MAGAEQGPRERHRPLTPEERDYIMMGFDRLCEEGFYDDRLAESASQGKALTRSYRDILEDVEIQDQYAKAVRGLDMPGIPEFADIEDYLDERDASRAKITLFAVRGEGISFRPDGLAYRLADVLASVILLCVHLARGIAKAIRRKPHDAEAETHRTRVSDYTEAELDTLARKHAYVSPLTEDGPFPYDEDGEDEDE